jgi:hypothetical protein
MMGASSGAFAWTWILTYSMYAFLWILLWNMGFNSFYISHYPNAMFTYSSFSPSLTGAVINGTWVSKTQLTSDQLKNLANDTQIMGNVPFCSGCTKLVFIIYYKDPDIDWFYGEKYWVYKYGFNPNISSNLYYIFWGSVDYVRADTSLTLSGLNITSNTTANQMLTTSITLTPTDLWTQITLFFGFLSGTSLWFTEFYYFGMFNFVLFSAFLYCIIAEILIPFGIHIPFV